MLSVSVQVPLASAFSLPRVDIDLVASTLGHVDGGGQDWYSIDLRILALGALLKA